MFVEGYTNRVSKMYTFLVFCVCAYVCVCFTMSCVDRRGGIFWSKASNKCNLYSIPRQLELERSPFSPWLHKENVLSASCQAPWDVLCTCYPVSFSQETPEVLVPVLQIQESQAYDSCVSTFIERRVQNPSSPTLSQIPCS